MSLPEFTVLTVSILSILPPCLVLFFVVSAAATAPSEPQGCRKLGRQDVSNLTDEYDYNEQGQHKDDPSPKKDNKIKIKALFSYPVKSCAGIEFDTAHATGTGLAYDRQFCFAEYIESTRDGEKTARWDCRTLRDGKYSKLTLIRPEIWVPDPSSPTYSPTAPEVLSHGVLVIRYPRVPDSPLTTLLMALRLLPRDESFHVPLSPDPSESPSPYPILPIRIFSATTAAISYAPLLPPSLSKFLETSRPLTLFRAQPSLPRPVGGNARPIEAALGFEPARAFADEYPLQMQSLGSIRALAGSEGVAGSIGRLSVRRFRPNVVVVGGGAYDEDGWKRVRFVPAAAAAAAEGKGKKDEDGVEVHVCCRTVRCRLPNVDPDTGVRHPVEPDRTLRTTRAIDDGAAGGCLGMMMVPAVEGFTVRVGDTVEVLERGEHFYTKGL